MLAYLMSESIALLTSSRPPENQIAVYSLFVSFLIWLEMAQTGGKGWVDYTERFGKVELLIYEFHSNHYYHVPIANPVISLTNHSSRS